MIRKGTSLIDPSHGCATNPGSLLYSEAVGSTTGSEGLGLYDVLCGRNKTAFNNIGNRRFRVTVTLALERYMSKPSRIDKSIVIKSVAGLVHANGGRFLQRQRGGGALVELSEKQSHEKVGHALRDMALAWTKSEESTSRHPSSLAPAPMETDFSPNASEITERQVLNQSNALLPLERLAENNPEAAFEDMVSLVVEPVAKPSMNSRDLLDDRALAPIIPFDFNQGAALPDGRLEDHNPEAAFEDLVRLVVEPIANPSTNCSDILDDRSLAPIFTVDFNRQGAALPDERLEEHNFEADAFQDLVRLVVEPIAQPSINSTTDIMVHGRSNAPITHVEHQDKVLASTITNYLETAAGRDSLDANILSWLVDESAFILGTVDL